MGWNLTFIHVKMLTFKIDSHFPWSITIGNFEQRLKVRTSWGWAGPSSNLVWFISCQGIFRIMVGWTFIYEYSDEHKDEHIYGQLYED